MFLVDDLLISDQVPPSLHVLELDKKKDPADVVLALVKCGDGRKSSLGRLRGAQAGAPLLWLVVVVVPAARVVEFLS
jgi:hypothetical protein